MNSMYYLPSDSSIKKLVLDVDENNCVKVLKFDEKSLSKNQNIALKGKDSSVNYVQV